MKRASRKGRSFHNGTKKGISGAVTLSVHGAAAAAPAAASAATSAAEMPPGALVADELANHSGDGSCQQCGHQNGAPVGTQPQQHAHHFLSENGFLLDLDLGGQLGGLLVWTHQQIHHQGNDDEGSDDADDAGTAGKQVLLMAWAADMPTFGILASEEPSTLMFFISMR